MTARESLALALTVALEAGLRIPCAGRDEWTSDDADERAHAAEECDGCPTTHECRAAADELDERHGVWAGEDRTCTPGTRRRKAS